MKLKWAFIRMPLLMIFVPSFLSAPNSSAQDQKAVSKLTIDGNTAVRFLFRRPNANYALPALIFRVADAGSPNWNAAPIDRYGRSAYISLSQMRSLIRQLDGDGIPWQVSSATESIEPFEKTPISENLLISIYAANGMATSTIPPKVFCKLLSQLNKVIEMKRAHWEFEYFRRGCGCQVPGYKSDAYLNDR
jgi:hypothetical protein